MRNSESTNAIVIAAGHPSVTGRAEACAQIDREKAIERLVRILRGSGVNGIGVVIGSLSDDFAPILRRLDVKQIPAAHFEEGFYAHLLSGVCGLGRASEPLFIAPVTSSFIRGATPVDLVDFLRLSSAVAVRASFMGRSGYPWLMSSELVDNVIHCESAGRARWVFEEAESRIVNVEVVDRFVYPCGLSKPNYKKWTKVEEDYDIPNPEECEVLLVEKCHVDRGLLAHSLKVAEVAMSLCARLRRRGCELDERLLLAAALLHDVARGHADHASVGARIVRGFGFHRVADLVAAHMGLAEDGAAGPTELDVLRMADRSVQDDRIVTLEERFRRKLEIFAGDESACEALEKKYLEAGRLRKKIEKAAGADIRSIVQDQREKTDEVSTHNLFVQTW